MEKTDDCWIWKGGINFWGYGQMNFNGRNTGAYRVSWILHNDEIPGKLFVLHKCDNPLCVNPDHLFLGTQKDNIQDCIKKGRFIGRRKATHCPQGHEYTPENTIQSAKQRHCRTCIQLFHRELYYRKRMKSIPLLPTSPEALFFCSLFHRRPTTPWTKKEVAAFKQLLPIEQADLDLLGRYYRYLWPPTRDKNILRHDLLTLFHHYPGECDRARNWCEAHPIKPKPRVIVPMPKPAEAQMSAEERAEAEAAFFRLMGRKMNL